MKINTLGNTGIEVTELCFGALPMGPLQKDSPVEENVRLTAKALEMGINFIDTAQMYQTYPPIKMAIEQTGIRPVIATKSTATDYAGMQAAIDEALAEMGVDYIDIFHLHAARATPAVFEQRAGALQCLLDNKAKGIVKAVGISCHSPQTAMAASKHPDIDVVFVIINLGGIGIIDGNREDMELAIKNCADAGKGLYLMKVLGGGNYVDDYKKCVDYARSLEGYASIAIGMVSEEELDYNVRYFSGQTEGLAEVVGFKKVFKVIDIVCIGCGKCIEACPNNVISMAPTGKAKIDNSRCIQCGYCVASCPMFAIRKI